MGDMRRSSDRIRAQVPVRLLDGEGEATSTDLSATGIFLVTDAVIELKKTIRFSIEYQDNLNAGVKLYLECFGEVVRVEQVNGKTGIGVRITEYHLERRDRRAREDENDGRRRAARPERRRPWDPPVRESQPEEDAA